jgi:hypothetical protein
LPAKVSLKKTILPRATSCSLDGGTTEPHDENPSATQPRESRQANCRFPRHLACVTTHSFHTPAASSPANVTNHM